MTITLKLFFQLRSPAEPNTRHGLDQPVNETSMSAPEHDYSNP